MKKSLFAAPALASSTAFALHCPKDMKAIDDALARAMRILGIQ